MVESFESYRSYLFAIAYRMLGSAMDAQDMAQETYLRYSATPKDSIISLKAFLTTIITRLCMDQLHLARRKRDVYLGPWLPEPLITPEVLEAVSLEAEVLPDDNSSQPGHSFSFLFPVCVKLGPLLTACACILRIYHLVEIVTYKEGGHDDQQTAISLRRDSY